MNSYKLQVVAAMTEGRGEVFRRWPKSPIDPNSLLLLHSHLHFREASTSGRSRHNWFKPQHNTSTEPASTGHSRFPLFSRFSPLNTPSSSTRSRFHNTPFAPPHISRHVIQTPSTPYCRPAQSPDATLVSPEIGAVRTDKTIKLYPPRPGLPRHSLQATIHKYPPRALARRRGTEEQC